MARLVRTDDTVEMTVPSSQTWKNGEIRLSEDGRPGIVMNGVDVPEGEKATLRLRGVVEIAAGATMSAGVVCEIDVSAQTVLAPTAGDADLGILLFDVTSGNNALVDMNP